MVTLVSPVKGGGRFYENRRSSSGQLGRVAAIGAKAEFTRVCASVQPIASNTRRSFVWAALATFRATGQRRRLALESTAYEDDSPHPVCPRFA